jgi:hypothetical protein
MLFDLLTVTRNATTGVLEFVASSNKVELENLVENNSVIVTGAGNKLTIDYEATSYDNNVIIGSYIMINLAVCKIEIITGGLTGAKNVKLSKYKN